MEIKNNFLYFSIIFYSKWKIKINTIWHSVYRIKKELNKNCNSFLDLSLKNHLYT